MSIDNIIDDYGDKCKAESCANHAISFWYLNSEETVSSKPGEQRDHQYAYGGNILTVEESKISFLELSILIAPLFKKKYKSRLKDTIPLH